MSAWLHARPEPADPLRPFAATAGLQARCPPQRIVDSLLPTRPILLKMRNQIAVELDRHQFFRDGNATFSLRAHGLDRWRRRWFEGGFGYGHGVRWSIPIRWSCHCEVLLSRFHPKLRVRDRQPSNVAMDYMR